MTSDKYSGMNRNSGLNIDDIDHIRQSISDILATPQGTRGDAPRLWLTVINLDRPAAKSRLTYKNDGRCLWRCDALGAARYAGSGDITGAV
ncbi:gPW/gp25 family protein [Yersinia pseudotuberculosis]|nr:gPW/gp25 family protein [Yersinia pseudotuberculosis]